MKEWQIKAANAKKAAVAERTAGLPHAFDQSIWQALKLQLKSHFKDRCAYCESAMGRHHGHVEHYRPKRRVDDDPAHLGYYWCAYDPENLLLSCATCNSSFKRNLFPVQPGTRAYFEVDLAKEEPLLLNPYVDEVSRHLKYEFNKSNGLPTGWMRGTTVRGKTSVATYGLNDSSIIDQRLEDQETTLRRWSEPEYMQKLRSGELSFPAARWAAIRNYFAISTA